MSPNWLRRTLLAGPLLLAVLGCHRPVAVATATSNASVRTASQVLRAAETECNVTSAPGIVAHDPDLVLVGGTRGSTITYGEFICLMNELQKAKPPLRIAIVGDDAHSAGPRRR